MNENTQKSTFDELWAQLNHNQRRFVIAYSETKSKKDAALAIGIEPNTASKWPEIVKLACNAYLNNMREAALSILQESAGEAAHIKVEGLRSTDPKIQQEAASEILDRVLGKPTQRQDVNLKSYRLVDDASGDTH